jgi:hypothetical protein
MRYFFAVFLFLVSHSLAATPREVNLLLDLTDGSPDIKVRTQRFDAMVQAVERADPQRRTVVLKIERGHRNIKSKLERVLASDEIISFFYMDSHSSPEISLSWGEPRLVWVLNGTVIKHSPTSAIIDEETFLKENRMMTNPFQSIRGRFSSAARVAVHLTDDRPNGKWEAIPRADLIRHLLGLKNGSLFVSREWLQGRVRMAAIFPLALVLFGGVFMGTVAYRTGHPYWAAVGACASGIAFALNHLPQRLPRPGFLFKLEDGEMTPEKALFQHRYRRRSLR